jgi:hypothetical protein
MTLISCTAASPGVINSVLLPCTSEMPLISTSVFHCRPLVPAALPLIVLLGNSALSEIRSTADGCHEQKVWM